MKESKESVSSFRYAGRLFHACETLGDELSPSGTIAGSIALALLHSTPITSRSFFQCILLCPPSNPPIFWTPFQNQTSWLDLVAGSRRMKVGQSPPGQVPPGHVPCAWGACPGGICPGGGRLSGHLEEYAQQIVFFWSLLCLAMQFVQIVPSLRRW